MRIPGGVGLAILLATTACATTLVAPPRPAYCVAAEAGLQAVTTTPASPYLLHHPARSSTATVVFLPGGSAQRRNAQRVWESMLEGAAASDDFRVVIPYWPEVEMVEDFRRTVDVIDEVLACYGGEPRLVHLAGFSAGGQAAFDLMLEKPQRFVTLLGAPGEFQLPTKPADLEVLRGKAAFNGVGELDEDWHEGVRKAHEMLTSAGVESVYFEFPGQRHSAGAGSPKDVLFEFWSAHSR